MKSARPALLAFFPTDIEFGFHVLCRSDPAGYLFDRLSLKDHLWRRDAIPHFPPYHHLRYSCLSIRRLEDILTGFIFTLTILNDHVQYRMRNYSITEAARELGVQRATLYEWIRLKKIPAPTAKVISRVRFRFWTEEELETLKRYKTECYQKKPSRKRKRTSDNTK
jgi:excisionase family DNA binding protein